MEAFWKGFNKQAGLGSRAKALWEGIKSTARDIKDAPRHVREGKQLTNKMKNILTLGTAGGLGLGAVAAGSSVAASNAKRKLYNNLNEALRGQDDRG